MTSSFPSKSTKRRRFLEQVEVNDLYVENPGSIQVNPISNLSLLNAVPNDDILVGQENVDDVPHNSSVINYFPESIDSNNLVNNITYLPFSSLNVNDEDGFVFQSSDSDSDIDKDIKQCSTNDLQEYILIMLAQWAVTFHITNISLSALLKILKTHKCFNHIPVDARTVLKTKLSNDKQIQCIPPGKYYHFGIENGLNNSFKNFPQFVDDIIKIVIGIDGLPLTKSSSSSFWPILGYISNFSNKSKVFLIGLYWGKEKPHDSNLFLKDMVNEMKELYKTGYKTSNGLKKVILDLFCCDSPAKSFILKTKSHNGFYSCTRCNIEGFYLNNRVCFPDIEFTKKNHLNFLNRTCEEYHVTESVSVLTELPEIDMVFDFSLDYMHLACLGVVKKLVLLWLGGIKGSPISVRLPGKKSLDISQHLLLLKSSMTSDFSRFPRGLNELPRWKATEFRLFLLYTAPIVLRGVLTEELYLHFISLHISFRILLVPNNSVTRIKFVEKLLSYFVEKFGIIYGKHFMSHNIHGLLHIVDDYRRFGPLDESSCFPFENYMKTLKKMIRKHEKPLEQVVKRYQELVTFSTEPPMSDFISNTIAFKKPHNNGPLVDNYVTSQFKVVMINNIKININSNTDCYIGITKEKKLNIFKVFNICYFQNTGKHVFIAKLFNNIEPLYNKPINSLKLGIAVVSDLSESFVFIDVDHTIQKYIIFNSHNKEQMAFPILHSLNN